MMGGPRAFSKGSRGLHRGFTRLVDDRECVDLGAGRELVGLGDLGDVIGAASSPRLGGGGDARDAAVDAPKGPQRWYLGSGAPTTPS